MLNNEKAMLALNDVDERYLESASAVLLKPAESRGHMKKKHLLTFALAAVLLLSLGAVSYAAGLLTPIFHSIRYWIPDPENREVSPEFAEVMDSYYAELEEKNTVYEAAEHYMNDRQPTPETVSLPEFDNSRITLSERYYNGDVLLLGVNLADVVPEMTVGYTPDEALLEKIRNVAFFWDVNGNDDLDALLAEGMLQEIYDDYLANRTDYAKEYDFRHQSAIEMDWMLKSSLMPEDYEAAWKLLRETGHLCVVQSVVYIGDHIEMEDGTDLGPTGQQNVDSDDPDAHSGNIFIEASSLPEAAQNLDRLNIRLRVKNTRIYYYMELGGPARYNTELVGEVSVPFCIDNAEK